MVWRGMALVVATSLAIGAAARAEGLVEERGDETAAQAEADYRAAIRATRAGHNAQALSLFERAMPHKRALPDLFYNLVQVARLEKLFDKVYIYAQAFSLLESAGKDADLIQRLGDAAKATLTARGRAPVSCSVRVPDGAIALVDGAPVADHRRPGFELPPGRYTLRVEQPDHVPFVEALEVVSGQAVTREVTPERIVYRGKVKILSKPADGVSVLVDGVKVGETPLPAPLELEAKKKLLLRFEKPGFDPWLRYVELDKGEELELAPILEKTAPGATP